MEITKNALESHNESFWDGFWFPGVFGFSCVILLEFVSLPVAWFLGGLLATFISYLLLSKPKKLGFIKFFALSQAIVLTTYAAFFFIPGILERIMPQFWAYALPIFLFVNIVYFIPPLDGNERQKWWKWFLGSFFIAGLIAWFMGFFIK